MLHMFLMYSPIKVVIAHKMSLLQAEFLNREYVYKNHTNLMGNLKVCPLKLGQNLVKYVFRSLFWQWSFKKKCF